MNWCDVIDASNYSDFKEVAESKILELKKNHITLKLTPIAWGKHINFYASSEDVSVKGRVRIKQKIISVQFYEYSIKGKKAALDKHYQQQGSFPKDAGVIVNKLFMAVEKIMELLEKKVTSSEKEIKMNQVISSMLTSQGVDHQVVGGEIIVGATNDEMREAKRKVAARGKKKVDDNLKLVGAYLSRIAKKVGLPLKKNPRLVNRPQGWNVGVVSEETDYLQIYFDGEISITGILNDEEIKTVNLKMDGKWREGIKSAMLKLKSSSGSATKATGAVKYSNKKAKEKAKLSKLSSMDDYDLEQKAIKEITALVEKRMKELGAAIKAIPLYKEAESRNLDLDIYQIIEDSIEESEVC